MNIDCIGDGIKMKSPDNIAEPGLYNQKGDFQYAVCNDLAGRESGPMAGARVAVATGFLV